MELLFVFDWTGNVPSVPDFPVPDFPVVVVVVRLRKSVYDEPLFWRRL